MRIIFRVFLFTSFLLFLIGCSTENPLSTDDAEVATDTNIGFETIGDYEHLATLPRVNLNPAQFRVIDDWIDPLTQAYIDGKDFLFIITRVDYIYEYRYFLEQPEPPKPNFRDPRPDDIERMEHGLKVFHFPDTDVPWFTHWDRAGRDRSNAGFTVEFDGTPIFENQFGVKIRKYLFGPRFGTSLDGLGVAGPGAPEIKEGFELKIYVKD